MLNWKFLLVAVLALTMLAPTVLAEGIDDVELNPNLDYLILVNDNHPYEFGGEYDRVLTETVEVDGRTEYVAMEWVPDAFGEASLVEKATYAAFVRLQSELAKRGLLVQLYAGYWSKEDQQWLVDQYADKDPPIWKVADVGCTGHHTGLQLWIYIWDTYGGDHYLWGAETQERQETMPQFKILHELMPDYGFIDRYPAGKEDLTTTQAEPYEIRFVGSAEVAHEIMDGGLCLEEYLELSK